MAKRKITQIACGGADMELFALCDDGTLWRYKWPIYAHESDGKTKRLISADEWLRLRSMHQDK